MRFRRSVSAKSIKEMCVIMNGLVDAVIIQKRKYVKLFEIKKYSEKTVFESFALGIFFH